MGFDKTRRPAMQPADSYSKVTVCSSAGAIVGPRGTFNLQSTSTVATTPTVMYLAPGRPGDIVEAFCTLASSSAGLALRTSSSGTYIGSSSGAFDQVQFFYTGGAIELIALTTSLWGVNAATTTASAGMPLLNVSTS